MRLAAPPGGAYAYETELCSGRRGPAVEASGAEELAAPGRGKALDAGLCGDARRGSCSVIKSWLDGAGAGSAAAGEKSR